MYLAISESQTEWNSIINRVTTPDFLLLDILVVTVNTGINDEWNIMTILIIVKYHTV